MKKLLWVVEKQFDAAPDKATWLEMAANLQSRYDILLLTGYRTVRFQTDMMGNNISYYRSSRVPVINRFVTYCSQLLSFRSLVKSWMPEVILFNTSNPLLVRYAALLKRSTNIKLIFDIRTLPVATGELSRYLDERLFGGNIKFAAHHFDGITYITKELQRFCSDVYRLPSHRNTVWTSGVNPAIFKQNDYNGDDKSLRILYHGSIAAKRRLDNAVRALMHLRDIDVRLELLGKGDAVGELKKLVKALNLGDRVRFSDSIAYWEVPVWINKGDIGILPFPDWPGWNTSSPIKLFEYLACAKPVIVSDIPAHRNVLQDKDFAFWAGDGSPEAVAAAIRKAYESMGQFRSLGQKAREFVTKEYTWEHQAKNLVDFIENAIK